MGLEVLFLDGDDRTKDPIDIFSEDAKHLIPFGIPQLDIILGGTGFPAGKLIEVCGWPGAAKTTFALEAAKAFSKYWGIQDEGKYAILWIESEGGFDPARVKYMGLDLEGIRVFPADTVEQGFEQIEITLRKCITKGIHLLVVWDTIAAAPTESEMMKEEEKRKKKEDDDRGEMYAGGMGEKARIISFYLRRLVNPLSESGSTLILVNQFRHTIKKGWGGPVEFTPGGEAIKFHAAIRVQMTRKGDLAKILPTGDSLSVGIIAEAFTLKNKIILEKQRCSLVVLGERGFNKLDTVVRYLKQSKIITVSGSWGILDFLGENIKFQNTEQLREQIEKWPNLENYMDYLIYKTFSTVSPLIKVKMIKRLWEYENIFFGKQKTALDDEELEVAKVLYKEMRKEG